MSSLLLSPTQKDSSASRNFAEGCGVLLVNDDPLVPDTPPGASQPPDFTTFMRAYQDMVYATSYRLVSNAAQAEDISQEVFIKAHQHFEMLQTSPTAGGWLKTVATNLSLNHVQRYRKRWRFFSEFTRSDDDGDETLEVDFGLAETVRDGLQAEDRRIWVEQALARLPSHQRVPLVLFHFEDMPYDEIAQKLGVSLAKVKTDILRARAALAKILAETGAPHETFQL